MSEKSKLPEGRHKQSFRAWDQTHVAIKRMLGIAAGDKRTLFGEKHAGQSVLMNALVLWFGSQTEQKQADILAFGMAMVNKIVNEEEASSPPLPRHKVVEQEEPKSAKNPKRDGGKRRA